MKTKTCTLFFIALTFLCPIIFCCSCQRDNGCPNPNVKVSLSRKDSFMPYQGNEALKFLHNNSDTQTFIGQGKETYYITEGVSMQGECPKDYESVRVKFLNQTSNDILSIDYYRDKNNFTANQSSNAYTFYKVSYKNKSFNTELLYTNSSLMTINGVPYDYVFLIGNDTSSNYDALRVSTGLLRIRIQNENWDLIP